MSEMEVVYDAAMHTGRKLWDVRKREDGRPQHFYEGYKLGICIDPSDCDQPGVPQKCLLSSSTNRAWGDPTTYGFLELLGPLSEVSGKKGSE